MPARKMLPITIRYEVTQSDIDEGDDTCENCPHQRGISRRVGTKGVRVYGSRTTIERPEGSYTYSNPSYTVKFQAANDITKEVYPGPAVIRRLAGSAGFRPAGVGMSQAALRKSKVQFERKQAAAELKWATEMLEVGGLNPAQRAKVLGVQRRAEERLENCPETKKRAVFKPAGGVAKSNRRRTYSVEMV